MKKSMTNSEMYDAIVALSQLEEQGALGLAIAKNLHRLKDESREYLEARDKLLEKYGEQQGGGRVRIPDKNAGALNAELREINDLECDVEICTVDKDTFTGGTIKSNQMEAILWMMEEEKTDENT